MSKQQKVVPEYYTLISRKVILKEKYGKIHLNEASIECGLGPSNNSTLTKWNIDYLRQGVSKVFLVRVKRSKTYM